jgi:hypothetical protein
MGSNVGLHYQHGGFQDQCITPVTRASTRGQLPYDHVFSTGWPASPDVVGKIPERADLLAARRIAGPWHSPEHTLAGEVGVGVGGGLWRGQLFLFRRTMRKRLMLPAMIALANTA